jgi:hypothetical protein
VELAGSGSLAAWSSPVGGPLAPDQLSVPADQGIGAGQERLPIRPWEDAADGGQEDTIGRLPAWAADLALEHTELVTQRQDLYCKSGFGPAADDEDLQREVDDGVEEEKSTVGGSSHRGWRQWGRKAVLSRTTQIELTLRVNGTR